MIPLHNLFEDYDDVADAFKSFKGDPSDVKLGKKFFKNGMIPFINPGDRRAEGYNAALKKVASDKETARIKALERDAKSGYQKGYDAAKQNKENIYDKPEVLNKNNAKIAGGVAAGIGAGALINKQMNKQK